MSLLVNIDDIDSFEQVKDYPPDIISAELLKTVRNLDEREELEPFIRSILFDSNNTPHGPAEIVDILTHKISIKKMIGIAAFILKGKSFPKVRPEHVSYQIYRLEKIAGLKVAIFAASGIVLDAAKEQFCGTAERLGCNYAVFDAVDIARLFVAYGFLCPRDGNRIVAGRCQCGYSPKKRIFNILQDESLKALALSRKLNQNAGVIVLPPGSGKTRIAAEDAKYFEAKKILYIAHTHEILDVAKSEYEAIFGESNVVCLSKNSIRNMNHVNLSTIQLASRNLETIRQSNFDYVVVDEFHHAAADSYRKLLNVVKPRYLLGLTATPFRSDRQDILELCGNNVLVNFELRSGIDTGVLSPYHYFGCFDDVDYSSIKHNGSMYDIGDLERALIIPERDKAIIKKWKELAEGKPTIAFCCSQKHAKRVSKSFNNAKIPAEVYLSTTSQAERTKLTKEFQNGALKVLCVVDIMNEGADLPYIECLLFLRPTESQRIFYQQLGRGLRKVVGKSHCIVIDFIANFKNAYKIIEYQGLLPSIEAEASFNFSRIHSKKELFNLPLGCDVSFDDKVIDIFASQALDPRNATRHNIGRILAYEYIKLSRRLGRIPNKTDVDRNLVLDSHFYLRVFGTWINFLRIVRGETT
jgi:superfamily II DNA or RNA helicase